MSASTSQGLQPSLIAVLASVMAAAVASESPRRTITGEAWRSATAPKISGETNAASAEVANANGLMTCRPLASSTVLNGTNHMPSAAPWRKKSATSSAYSALRTVLSTQTERTDGRRIQALMDGVAVGRQEFEEERVSAVRVGRQHPKSRASTLVDIVCADGQRDDRLAVKVKRRTQITFDLNSINRSPVVG